MQESRIAGLLEPFLGPKDQRPNTEDLLQRISTYIDILQRWNARINLTAIRNEDEIVSRHFGESLFAARHLFPERDRIGHGFSRASSTLEERKALAPEGRRPDLSPQTSMSTAPSAMNDCAVADIGSGAGFPGIPLKLWAPHISLTLIESNHKKAAFLREVSRALTLTNVNIQTARAESLTDVSFDVVTLRAVERFESILPTAAGLISKGGRLALLIGQAQVSQAQSALSTLSWSRPIPIPNSQSRVLVVGHRLEPS